MFSKCRFVMTAVFAAAPAAAFAQHADTIVKNAGAPIHAGIAALHEELSIGQAAGTPEYRFASLTEVAPAPDGSVLVAQQGSGAPNISVRQFDAQGKYMRTLGKPGQYRHIGGITALADGRVAVIDNDLYRLDIYDPAGKIVAAWSTGETTPDPGIGRLSSDEAGTVYMKLSLGATPNSPYTLAYLRIDPKTGHVLDTLRVPAAPQMPMAMLSHKVAPNAPPVTGVEPLTPRFVTNLSRQGYWITGRSDRYAIDLRLPTRKGSSMELWKPGSPVTSIRRTGAAAVPFSDDERKAVRTTLEGLFKSTDPGWKWNGPELPRVKPNFNHFATGADGRIWVMVYDPSKHYSGEQLLEMDRDATTLWDVYEPDGRYLGQVRTEHGITPLSRGDNVWMIRHDAKGGETVVRARIAWGA